MTAPKITTAASLFAALDERPREEDARKTWDEAIWAQCEQEGAILVTDLSGFTRTTKSHGILHFLNMFRRFQRHCEPLINKYGGTLLKQEADDLIGVFPSAVEAIQAGIDMLKKVNEVNADLLKHEQIGLSLGVEFGKMLRLEDDAYGDPVNVAFKLGEDIAERGELLVGQTAYDRALSKGYEFPGCDVSDPKAVVASTVSIDHYSVRLSEDSK